VTFLGAEAHRRAAAGDGRLLGATGWPSPYVSVRIANDGGDPVRSGEVGEVPLRGDQITKGYWNSPEATQSSFVDGWFRTGDLGRRDEVGLRPGEHVDADALVAHVRESLAGFKRSHLARHEPGVGLQEWHAAIPDYRVADYSKITYTGGVLAMTYLPLEWDT